MRVACVGLSKSLDVRLIGSLESVRADCMSWCFSDERSQRHEAALIYLRRPFHWLLEISRNEASDASGMIFGINNRQSERPNDIVKENGERGAGYCRII